MVPFYSDAEPGLRLGDVITGFYVATPAMHAPIDAADLSIRVYDPKYLVVLTPCCSIEEKSFCLAPLIQVRPAFFKNSFLAADLTRLNSPIQPADAYPDGVWGRLSEEQREREQAEGVKYAFQDCFIYSPHVALPPYSMWVSKEKGNQPCGHYMVDFKKVFRVECDLIIRDKPVPAGMKVLQLSVWSRETLRFKLGHFFSRVTAEDQALLG